MIDNSISPQAYQPLAGRRVMIVEDEYLFAAELERIVTDLGAEVLGPAPSIARATEIVQGQRVDLALLDINLNYDLVYPLADVLMERGIGIVFVTA